MAVYDRFINCTISLIERPVRTGIGGDIASETLVEATLLAIRLPFNAFSTAGDLLIRDADSVLVNADNSFFIDLDDEVGNLRLLKAGDLVTWAANATGGPTSGASDNSQDEILRVNIWDAPSATFDRAHIELVTRGSGG